MKPSALRTAVTCHRHAAGETCLARSAVDLKPFYSSPHPRPPRRPHHRAEAGLRTPGRALRPSTFLPLLFSSLCVSAPLREASASPPPSSDLRLSAPITTWDEALPLGNGLFGGLLWGEDNLLRLSLDRGDLWDNRVNPRFAEPDFTWKEIAAAVKRGDQKEIIRRFDSTYNQFPSPTKLPGGRLEMTLPDDRKAASFHLDLSEAVASVKDADGKLLAEGFYSAQRNVAVFRIPGTIPPDLRFVPPAAVKKLGYPDAQTGGNNKELWFTQPTVDGAGYAAFAATRRSGGSTLLVLTISRHEDDKAALPHARAIVRNSLRDGYDIMLERHRAYWIPFWKKSSVTIPDPPIQAHYDLVNYYLGSASRPGAPPMPLQGVWTADGGGLPPWKGDYHHDLNTQMTYLHYLAAGRFEEGRAFLDFMYGLLPTFQNFAAKFYQTPGAAIPAVMTLDGQPLGGWIQYSLSPTNGAWVAWMFHRHWRYTRDPADLERAYQFCSEIGTCLEHLLEKQPDGTLALPLSSSPEIHNNSLRAWLKPNSNYDRDCMQALFAGLTEMAGELEKEDDAKKWNTLATSLGPRLVDDDAVLMFARDEPFTQSHRHHSQIMSIHPFGSLHIEQGKDARRIINASLDKIDQLGTQAWTGYSFSWIASAFARAGRAEDAIRYLDIYERAFILRNGFHVNGDQLKAGFSGFTYRPFTLEGNFLAAEAVHDMLLQSWDGIVRLFPATPWRWHDASFRNLRAEGGLTVSARRKNNATFRFTIHSEHGGPVRILDNFGGRKPGWSRDDVSRDGDHFVVTLKPGGSVGACLPVPDAPPPAPADVSMPLKVTRRLVTPNKLPLCIGADTSGGSRFTGTIARASIFSAPLTDAQIGKLAATPRDSSPAISDTLLASWSPPHASGDQLADITKRFEAAVVAPNHLTIPHSKLLDGTGGLTLEAWIKPGTLPASGARIIDKSPVGGVSGYLLDTYPGNSLRLICQPGHLTHDAKLPPDQWSHVAATIDPDSGRRTLYLNGKPVATEP